MTSKKGGILLVDVDSKIPNLALMKISTVYKNMGYEVGFNVSNPEYIYASCIFKKNRHKLDGLDYLYPNAIIDKGGSGYDVTRRLPDQIEQASPDYDLYPNCDRFYGFSTRGCIRNCYFCIVNKKEGKFRKVYPTAKQCLANIIGWNSPDRFDKIEFLDNNILSDKQWFMELTGEILANHRKWKVDFNQGLDVRLLDSEIAERLAKLKPITCWKFAFDSMAYKDAVLRGIQILKDAGIDTKHKTMFYVYCHNDEAIPDAVERCNILKENNVTAYSMVNMDVKQTRNLRKLKRWTRPWLFWKTDWEEFIA